ncbi:helix-turn-helix domain-containing protein [Nocardia uniformis]|uniref:Helix-turn-helix domain-containing protein n=1 Tax=Nocardia uniformis TaxID=53432 RepID=A0A849C2U3_9NOCA|nr:helix-turn-helix domain-containing protein [Nocardia uniformis]NNH73002.1 helix-turn-helix domain-containing protein [Nocardia uniformis]
MDTGNDTWLSTEEVARRLKIPEKTLAVWASGHRGPRFARIGRFRRYKLDDLLAWEAERLAHGGGSQICFHNPQSDERTGT